MEAWAGRQGPVTAAGYEFLRFGVKQGWACLFGGLLLGLMIVTKLYYPHGAAAPRYDVLVVACLVIQAILLWFRMETVEEAKVILVFHLVGTLMELFKTSTGSWHYPEFSYLRVGHVPLFSGFMYASVGSYLARVWRLFDFRFTHHPGLPAMMALSAAIYANFFTDHWGIDFRLPLLGAAALLFGRTTIYFRVWRVHRRMPLLLGFGLVALFIWFGENIATAAGAWLYPSQVKQWTMVSPAKLTSWSLLLLISYTSVAGTMQARPRRRPTRLGCFLAALAVMGCGLIWRLVPMGLPVFWLHYGGGVLWGAMVLLLVVSAERSGRPSWRSVGTAAAIALAAELFRLYHQQALDAFRMTLAGALLFGRIFDPWNIAVYWIGIGGAALGRRWVVSARRTRGAAGVP
jgi:uncharacterized membrane protein YoaT (DUF817 family)